MKQLYKYVLIFCIAAFTGTGTADTSAKSVTSDTQQQKSASSSKSVAKNSKKSKKKKKVAKNSKKSKKKKKVAKNSKKSKKKKKVAKNSKKSKKKKKVAKNSKKSKKKKKVAKNGKKSKKKKKVAKNGKKSKKKKKVAKNGKTPKAKSPAPIATPAPAPLPAPKVIVGSASLSWTIPSKRENGDSLSSAELGRYEIYYTSDSGKSETIRVDNPAKTNMTITNLEADTYYFAMAAVDKNGVFSELSNEVPKTVK